MTREHILSWLREDDPSRLENLLAQADQTRRENVGDAVHFRGLIEFSNFCRRQCGYCGLRADNLQIGRYRMTELEILDCAAQAVAFGCGTVVLQSGEDPALETDWLARIVQRIKASTPLAVTLSVGERSEADLRAWRAAGADRYLLRFETSDASLYEHIHPSLPGQRSDRMAQLRLMRTLGYQVGSGVMIGIPGQHYDSLANDIALFAELELDMIGVGPYLPHPETPLGALSPAAAGDQVPNTELMTYKVIALTRLVCPRANIPSTTALATVNLAQGRELGLMRGANVVMPNMTPPKYRALYEIYPAKACIRETPTDCNRCLRARVESIGRHVGSGRGDTQRSDESG
jgi:biotin synthase